MGSVLRILNPVGEGSNNDGAMLGGCEKEAETCSRAKDIALLWNPAKQNGTQNLETY
jgi:hypothetical protein